MSTKIRSGTINVSGSSLTGMARVQWDDELEVNRDQADEELSGQPVIMRKGGRGTIEMMSGAVATGYATSMVLTYKEITVAGGVESSATKTATWTSVTVAAGGNVQAGARGARNYAFEYATCTVA